MYSALDTRAYVFPGVVDRSPFEIMNLRSAPLGYDRYGAEYWILSAQESMTLFPFGSASAALWNYELSDEGYDPALHVDPCVLRRSKSGTWGYFKGGSLKSLLDDFAEDLSHEKILRDNLICRLFSTRSKLYEKTLQRKLMQHEWLTKRFRNEEVLAAFENKVTAQLMQPESMAGICRSIEVLQARLQEVRTLTQYSNIYRSETDPVVGGQVRNARSQREHNLRRLKKIRELIGDEVFDLHPTKGWLRFHAMNYIRGLAASTTASRLHSDQSVISALKETYSKSNFRLHWVAKSVVRLELIQNAAMRVIPRVMISTAIEASTEDDQPQANSDAAMVVDTPSDTAGVTSTELIDVVDVKQNVDGNSNVETESPNTELKANEEAAGVTTEKSEYSNLANDTSALSVAPEEDSVEDRYAPVESKELLSPEDAHEANHSGKAYASYAIICQARVKPIEQLHPITGEVMRIYPSGTIAAAYLRASQAGISLCCSGKLADAYGFRWRFYEGPSIDCKRNTKNLGFFFNYSPLIPPMFLIMYRGKY